jgi:hypothetical protein
MNYDMAGEGAKMPRLPALLPQEQSLLPSDPALALAVNQEAVFLFFFLGEGFVFLFVQEAVQGQVRHVFPVGAAREIEFAVFMHIGFGHLRLLGKSLL